jgi:hypothetical protein
LDGGGHSRQSRVEQTRHYQTGNQTLQSLHHCKFPPFSDIVTVKPLRYASISQQLAVLQSLAKL